MEHQFDVAEAKKYGVDEAVMIRHFRYWIIKNKANKKNYHDGRTWTYNAVKAYVEVFPYWTGKQIRRILESLQKQHVLIKGNYNKRKNDQTTWYAFRDEKTFIEGHQPSCPNGQKELSKRAKGVAQTGKPLPDNNHVGEPSKLSKAPEQNLSQADAKAEASRLLVRAGVHEKVITPLVSQHSLEEIEQCIKNGLAREKYEKGFVLQPGYIVEALNKAREEGKTIQPTKKSRQLTSALDRLNRRKKPKKPMSQAKFQKKRETDKKRLAAAS